MARLMHRERRRQSMRKVVLAMLCMMRVMNTTLMLYMFIMDFMMLPRKPCIRVNPNVYQNQVDALNRLVRGDDKDCHDQLRVNRHTFMRLCHLLEENGLKNSREVTLVEKVAIFLWIIGHHNKNRPTKFQFVRSGETVSRHFNTVLLAVLRLYSQLWYRPQPVPANDPDHRWRWFENCLGALDGTFVTVHPPAQDRARYRSRKGDYATNVLGGCSRNLRFIYALSGWEGSATDSRVLRNALVRPHGLRIPQGHYYLVDAGYTNGPGLLAPYRGQRYHINIWRQGHQPQSREEYFNMNHASARNVIERCFGVLKMRFAILRSCSYYPMRTQCRIVTACCLIHNLIKREMAVDPIEIEYTAWEQANVHVVPPDDYIGNIEPTTQWTEMRDNLATTMYNNWLINGPAS
ncbi:protein ALP1-like [Actinidia eriantha]|uniref:protein ALP1-like n=1 Tax=Actinidia eriantha TaxID=165200 RepID=UPI00258F24C5|nr:protein ALP1-like [Actinidia eriantha]